MFDGEKKEPYTETDVAKPISVYGASKLQGEIEIKQTLETYFILRTSWLYSEHGANFMKTMLRLAETRDEISVVSDQIGTPTYAGDLADVILKIISSKNTNFGLYHYSNEGVASWYDFAKTIFEASNLKIKLNAIKTEAYPTPAKRNFYNKESEQGLRYDDPSLGIDWRLPANEFIVSEKDLVLPTLSNRSI